MKQLIILILLPIINGCETYHVNSTQDMPTPCDRACDVLKRADCPEGSYNMCNHYRSNECMEKINVGCVMEASSRKDIIANCNVKCEW